MGRDGDSAGRDSVARFLQAAATPRLMLEAVRKRHEPERGLVSGLAQGDFFWFISEPADDVEPRGAEE
jgi:hypothetical protein